MPLNKDVAPPTVLGITDAGRLFACDFTITGAEHFEEMPWGYEQGRLINIDHHAPTPQMRRHVSSANLALLYVAQKGMAQSGETVVINHTDCDSVLSAGIMCGHLEPLPEFGAAAIAADHTGEVNAIADLLQALDAKRDYEYSLRNLRLLMEGFALDEEAQILLDKRHARRALAKDLVDNGTFTMQNGVAWALLDDSVDSEFFPALLPDAILIITFSPRPGEAAKWNAKFRLGNAAPANLEIERIIKPIDAGFGGRWNAGSNKRGGGSTIPPNEYANAVLTSLCK